MPDKDGFPIPGKDKLVDLGKALGLSSRRMAELGATTTERAYAILYDRDWHTTAEFIEALGAEGTRRVRILYNILHIEKRPGNPGNRSWSYRLTGVRTAKRICAPQCDRDGQVLLYRAIKHLPETLARDVTEYLLRIENRES